MDVNIHEAKTHLSRLVAQAVEGETVVIARAGVPVAKLTRVDAPGGPPRRTGFLEGEGRVPDDFNEIGADEIEALFEGKA